MLSCPFHSFDVSFAEAKSIQNELRGRVELCNVISDFDAIDIVGGVDVAFMTPHDGSFSEIGDASGCRCGEAGERGRSEPDGRPANTIALAVAVTYDRTHDCIVEKACATAPVYFPYVPGFLSFREGPAVLRAIGELSELPGVMLYDGCGIAHPRGLGLAAHMALLTGVPSIGCAKSKLCGSCDLPGSNKGSWTEILYHGSIVGTCLRTRDNVRPIYVSPGSGFSVDSAREFTIGLALKYRLPEPTRLAHANVTEFKKQISRDTVIKQ